MHIAYLRERPSCRSIGLCAIANHLSSETCVNNRVFPVSSEIADLLLFVSYFASQSKGIKFGDYFFDVYCVNSEVLG